VWFSDPWASATTALEPARRRGGSDERTDPPEPVGFGASFLDLNEPRQRPTLDGKTCLKLIWYSIF
jgi:hypothetical protein